MALRNLGAEYHPWFMECVTTVPFGFLYVRRRENIFAVHGSLNCDPYVGVRRALDILGFTYSHQFFHNTEDALKNLRVKLREGPVIAGPVETRLLKYDPAKRHVPPEGDHYVLVTEIDQTDVTLQDPEGFPYVRMKVPEFMKAWRAERISYKKGPYTMIAVKHRKEQVTKQSIYRRVLEYARRNLRERPPRSNIDYIGAGVEAIRRLADDLPKYRPARAWRAFFYFSFPLSAQRCHDVALFLLRAPTNGELRDGAGMKLEQSRIYSELIALTPQKKWRSISEGLLEVADLEDKFRVLLETKSS